MSLYKSFGKRLFDLAAATAALILLSPVLALTAALVATKLGRPVLFLQLRSGWHGRPFQIVKFRSMLDAIAENGEDLPDEQRLTAFGRWLRASSLDELPGLWNVVNGSMSLVGPRPLHTRYDALYSPSQRRRLDVRPGITGWAQVNGRNALTWPEKFDLDLWYVENQSFWVDLKIILATVASVLRRHGINAADEATMPEFRGNGALDAPAPAPRPDPRH